MKGSLIGTVFLFACIFGQNTPDSQESVQLVQNVMPCISTKECQLKVGPSAQCKDKSCLCPMGGQWRECLEDESLAVTVFQSRELNPGSFIGYPCNYDGSCNLLNSYCRVSRGRKGRCDCKKGFIPSHDNIACHKIADHLDEFCLEDNQCLVNFKNSTCSPARKCECLDKYHEAALKCWKTIEYQDSCGDKHECWHMGGHCDETSRTCICDVNRVINSRKTFCLDIVGNNERCFEDLQCTIGNLKNSICFSGHCRCKDNYHYSNVTKNCIKNRVYGNRCKSEECYEITDLEEVNSLICNNTLLTCDCAEGFHFLNDKCYKDSNSSSQIALYPSLIFGLLLSVLLILL